MDNFKPITSRSISFEVHEIVEKSNNNKKKTVKSNKTLFLRLILQQQWLVSFGWFMQGLY